MEGNTVESQFEDILSLVIARSRGEVGSDAVENALASLVPPDAAVANRHDDQGSSSASTSEINVSHSNQTDVIQDTDNYDFDGEDEDVANTKPAAQTTTSGKPKRKVGRPKLTERSQEQKYAESLENIPLGKMGSRMLITFGDGPYPRVEVVSAALLGARSSLQRAVLDGRALHRRMKDQWYHARASALQHRKQSDARKSLKKTTGVASTTDLVVDSELSFRALQASYERDVPCGFDIKSLETLFPEEMNAYQRWKKMHDAYKQNSDDAKSSNLPEANEETADHEENNETEIAPSNGIHSSRLYERLGNFDVRTNHMNSDSYIKFSDVRKGSFLPRKTMNAETKEWAKTNLSRVKGRPSGKKRTTWTNLHPSSVIFLHWLGFDPMSSLPPPDEDTTQALGFLAHDFLGKIVEKAVVLHLQDSKKKSKVKKGTLPELSEGDQLDVEDIQRAISTTKLKSLYTSSNGNDDNSHQVAQLYFGPGFEDRLELELEEIFGGKNKRLTAEEIRMRQEEEALFSNLGPPPLLSNLISSQGLDENDDDVEETLPASKKRQRTTTS